MVGLAELESLQVRKQELLAQSEANRRVLHAECENLRGAAESVGRGFSFLREARPALFLAAPVLGFLLARKWRPVGRVARNVIFSPTFLFVCASWSPTITSLPLYLTR